MYLISFSFGLERRVVAVRDCCHGALFGWTAGLCSKWSPARQAKIIGWPKASCAVRADIAPATTEIERMLDQSVTKLGSAGGLAAIAGVLFAVELLNQERLLADAACDSPHKAFSSCLQAFARNGSTFDLLAASAHFALDLVAALSDHQRVIDQGLRGAMDRSAECGEVGAP